MHIVLRNDKRSGELIEVIVRYIKQSATHPQGVKVRLANAEIGREKVILDT